MAKIWNQSQLREMNRKYSERIIIVEPSAISRAVPTEVCLLVGTSSSKYTYMMFDLPGHVKPKNKKSTIVK